MTADAPGNATRNAWLTIGDPGLAEAVALSPAVDAVTVDLQHSEIRNSRLADLIRAIDLGGAHPMARLAGSDPAEIGRLLDLGFTGLIMPNVTSAPAAARFVNATRYPPRGPRSYGPVRKKGEADPWLWAMIESSEGLEAAAQIAAVDGIDGLFVGPGDLGLSLGIGVGQNRQEPEFVEALSRIREAAALAGCGLGIHSTELAYSKKMFEEGFSLVTVWVDVAAVHSSLRTVEKGLSS
ncbi:MAG: aldolase/citrate lyase family protein [Acidimicrobiia bacterium]|nr:aldolase/citrate lyase family protein [Acidimicrobiia bacterium]MDH3462453.1 aldolase/citrate lyase family protein [Acidimicrobiia bacterium]